MKKLIAAAGVIAVALTSIAAFAEDAPVTLRLSHWVPPSHPLQPAFEAWAKSIYEESHGSITIKIFPAQQLGKAFDHYDMARDGIADITDVSPGYQPGRFPIFALGSVPFLVSNAKGGSAAIDAWYRKYAPTEMKDVYFCSAHLHDPGTFHSNKPITVPADVRGLKIRPATGTIANFITLLGGTTVNAAAPEARDVIARGVADGITFPWRSLILFGIDKVVKYHLDMPFYVTPFVDVMNKAKYEFVVAGAEKGHRRPLYQRMGGETRLALGRFRGVRQAHDQGRARSGVHRADAGADRIVAQGGGADQGGMGRERAQGRRQSRRDFRRVRGQPEEIRRRLLTTADPAYSRRRGDRFIQTIEWLAAIFVAIVTIDTFVSVMLRYFFAWQIPDSFDVGRMLLGILIFWGIAATSFRGTHITVDLVWSIVGPRWKRYIDVFATLVLLFVIAIHTLTLVDKVVNTYRDNIETFDLHLPIWPFFLVAWLGDFAAVLLIAVRTYRLIFHPETLIQPRPQPVE